VREGDGLVAVRIDVADNITVPESAALRLV
jgi:hypothetical protein